MRTLTVSAESWPLHSPFTISRGSRTAADVVTVTLEADNRIGRGECVPNRRYGETVDGVVTSIRRLEADIAAGLDRATLANVLPPGAARNALDCALWDLEAKRAGRRVWDLAGLETPVHITTAYTISLDTPDGMEAAARAAAARPLLKLKLDGTNDVERVRRVRTAAPDARLIVDANEAWRPGDVARRLHALAELEVELVEQPLPAGEDDVLYRVPHAVPICADESCHTGADVTSLVGRYDYVNIKLDKTGGLTEALRLVDAARAHGMGIMVGCMMGTSLGIAPALLVAPAATYVDLDAPLWLTDDRVPPLHYECSVVSPADPAVWG